MEDPKLCCFWVPHVRKTPQGDARVVIWRVFQTPFKASGRLSCGRTNIEIFHRDISQIELAI